MATFSTLRPHQTTPDNMNPIPTSSTMASFIKNQTDPVIKKALVEKLLPDLAMLVDAYYVDNIDPDLATQPILFGPDGDVLNPQVRENCKRILCSAFCSPRTKELVFETMCQADSEASSPPALVIEEFVKIADEIVAEGGRLELEDVHLKTGYLDLNCRGANLRGLNVIGSVGIACDMTDADLTGAKFIACTFLQSKIIAAKSAGLVIKDCSFIYTEVTGTNLVDPKALKCRSAATDPNLWAYDHLFNRQSDSEQQGPERYFLHGIMEKQAQAVDSRHSFCIIS